MKNLKKNHEMFTFFNLTNFFKEKLKRDVLFANIVKIIFQFPEGS